MFPSPSRDWLQPPVKRNPRGCGQPNKEQLQLILKIECEGNLKELIENESIDLKQDGVCLRWKEVQEKDSNPVLTFLAVLAGMNEMGLEMSIRHAHK